MILLVSYDLKVPGRDYTKLYEVIKTAPSWWHYLESTWVIYTTEPVITWRERIKNVIDNNDRLLIVDITRQARDGWLDQKAWDWLRQHEGF